MSIKTLINKINEKLRKYETCGIPSPAADDEIIMFKKEFEVNLKHALPPIFEELLSYSNGVMFNGLVIWPTKKYWLFQESFIEANFSLRETFNEDFFYFGNRDEELYIFNPSTGTYQGIEYIGDTAWIEFDNLAAMLTFMLNRSLGE